MGPEQGLNVGTMIEQQLEEAGVELATGYRLAMLDTPGIEMGDLTIDVTNRSRLFHNFIYRNLVCAVGIPYTEGKEWTREEAVTALAEGDIQMGRVSLKAFQVDIKRSTLRLGRLRPNLSLCVSCQHCGRTYHNDELKIATQGHKFFCKNCLDKATKEFEAMSKRDRKKKNARQPTRHMYRLDRERNILRYEYPRPSKRMTDEITTALQIPPSCGGILRLPRPFVMFEPGTSKVVWEPEADDVVGQKLKGRCDKVLRGKVRGQQPVPLKQVIEAYAPKGWDPRPWMGQEPLKVPGIIGVQLLVDSRLAGWVPIEELTPDLEGAGWWREFPGRRESNVPAREV